jgi:hypothetical protein
MICELYFNKAIKNKTQDAGDKLPTILVSAFTS